MSIITQVQETTFFCGGSVESFNADIVLISIIVATSGSRSKVSLHHLRFPIFRGHKLRCSSNFQWLGCFLEDMGVPQTFLDGHDCDMVANLYRMLCDTVMPRHGIPIDHFCILVMVFKTHCCYNIVNTPPCFFGDQEVPALGLVRRIASESGEHSLPAGATTLERFKIQHEEDDCVICFEELKIGDDVARLPCSHVCHYNCILEWFVQNGTCPLCRFPCSDHASFED